jgi:hypothetical protein
MLTIRTGQMAAIAQANPGQKVISPCKPDFIEIDLMDQDDQPVAGVKYRIQLPDQSIFEGQTDANGKARIDNIDSGQCTITLLTIDRREWSPA